MVVPMDIHKVDLTVDRWRTRWTRWRTDGQPGGPDGGPNGGQGGPDGGPNGHDGPDGGQPGEQGGPDGGPNAGQGGPDGGQPGEQGGPDAQAGGVDAQPQEGGPDGGQYPEGEEAPTEGAGLVEGSILIKVDQPPPTDQTAQYTQEDITAKSHVTLSGQATCGCSDNLVLRINKFLAPNSKPSKEDLITVKKIDGEGAFSIVVPKDENPIAIKLLVDQNGDGLSRGERFAVIEQGGKMLPSSDITDLSLDASDREPDNQAQNRSKPDGIIKRSMMLPFFVFLVYESCVVSKSSLCSDHICS